MLLMELDGCGVVIEFATVEAGHEGSNVAVLVHAWWRSSICQP